MSKNLEKHKTGSEAIDILQGAVRLADSFPFRAERIKRFKRMASFVNAEELIGPLHDVTAAYALFKPESGFSATRDVVLDVELIGAVCVPTAMEYILAEQMEYDADTLSLTQPPVRLEGFALNFMQPVFVGYDPQKELGYVPQVVQVPIDQIRTCLPAA